MIEDPTRVVSRAVPVTAEWALAGKPPNSSRDYRILRCSQGRLHRDDFAQIMARWTTGTSEDLPQVTIAWVGDGQDAHLVLAIKKWSSDHSDADHRPIAFTRYFCVPYTQVTAHPVSYESLYNAFKDDPGTDYDQTYARQDADPSPTAPPLTGRVPLPDPAGIAANVDTTARCAAALLLTGRPVCVLGGEFVPMEDRLRFLDAVAALLPYGMRTKLTASTWTSGRSEHSIRLGFARYPPADAHTVTWGEVLPEFPAGDDEAYLYLKLLTQHARHTTELVKQLGTSIQPLSFGAKGRTHALALLNDLADELSRRDAQYVPRDRIEIERLLVRCGESLRAGDPYFGEVVGDVGAVADKWGDSFAEGERSRFRDIIGRYGLLGPIRWHEDSLLGLYRALLVIGYGPDLTLRDTRQILADAEEPAPALIAAMRLMPSLPPVAAYALANRCGTAELAAVLREQPTPDLVRAAAEMAAVNGPDARAVVLGIHDELVHRGGAGDDLVRSEMADALLRHDYLLHAVELVGAEGENRFTLFRALLGAAYGEHPHPREFQEAVDHPCRLRSAEFFAAAVDWYGAGAGEAMRRHDVERLHTAKLSAGTVQRVLMRLDQPANSDPFVGEEPRRIGLMARIRFRRAPKAHPAPPAPPVAPAGEPETVPRRPPRRWVGDRKPWLTTMILVGIPAVVVAVLVAAIVLS